MNHKKITILLYIFVILIIAGYLVLNNYQTSGNIILNKNTQTSDSQISASSNNSNQDKNQEQKIKLSETRYWNYAYLISNNNLDNKEKLALSGFDRKKETLPDGSVKIILKTLSSNYNNQTYILKNGEKLYFIETSLGDDPQFKEYNLGDDVAIKVDSDGYILK